MKITFLGTGTSQGVPLIGCKCQVCLSDDTRDKRLRSSVMIENNGAVFVVDSGPDFRQQMLRVGASKLTALILTHEHIDHIGGLDDVRAFNFIEKKFVDIYASHQVQRVLKRTFHYIFAKKKYPGIPRVRLRTVSNKPFTIAGTGFTPILAYHHKLPVFGYRIGNFTYITDANHIPSDELKKISGSGVVILNALRKEKHISHFTFDQAVRILRKINPRKGFLTHISHQLGLHSDIEKELPGFIKPAYDGMVIEL